MATSAREENKDAMQKIDTTALSGGVLPEDLFDEFFQEVQDESVVLDMVRTVPMPRENMRIPKIGVGERLRTAQTEGSSIAEASASTDSVPMTSEKASIYWSLTSESVEDVVDDVPNIVMDQMTQQFAVDTEDLGFNGDEASATTFEAQNDGWITLATARGSPTYSHDDGAGTPLPIDSSMFNGAIQTIESKYLRADPVFFLNTKQLQAYAHHLTERESGLGDAVLFGESDLNPFGYDLVGSAMVPEGNAIFTPPQNLIYGLHREVEVDVLEQSDDIHEQDLFAKYATRVRDDFQIEDETGLVLVTNIEAV